MGASEIQAPGAGSPEAASPDTGLADTGLAESAVGGWDFPVWDPVLLDLPGPFDLRYYGLMYVVGFFAANWILVRLARDRFFPVAEERVGDLIFYCIFGVILGGRLGYGIFYDQRILGFPEIVQFFNGGLAFHGGLLGVVVAMVWFARKFRVPTLRVGDCLAIAVTPGIFAVRMANFINGELYGRVTDADTPLAMQFPTDDKAMEVMGLSPFRLGMRGREQAVQLAADLKDHRGDPEWLAERIADLPEKDGAEFPIPWQELVQSGRLDWQAAKALQNPDGSFVVPYRHPSQLYEGVGEGILVGLLLLAVYLLVRRKPTRPGVLGGLFLIGYGTVRWGIELVRRPDQQFIQEGEENLGEVFLGMTMGQTLCSGMIAAGVVLLVASRRMAPIDPAASPPESGAERSPQPAKSAT